MTPWWVAVLVMLGSVTITAVINFHIKFSPDAATARRKLGLLASRTISVLNAVYLLYLLGKEALSAEPVTRGTVVKIAVLVGILVLSSTLSLISLVVKALSTSVERLVEVDRSTTNIIKSLNEVVAEQGHLIREHVQVTRELADSTAQKTSLESTKNLPAGLAK